MQELLLEGSLQTLFESTCSTYKFYAEKARALREQIEQFIMSFLKEKLFNLISFAKECKIKLSFSENDEFVIWIFSCYYSVPIHFEKYRNVIDLEHCKLYEDFIRAYTADNNDIEAYKWFSQFAKSRKY